MNPSSPIALVTGGNRGLGLETARQLLSKGWAVWVAARDSASGADAVKELGARSRFVQLDVADEASVRSASEELDGTEELSALVNNAGASFEGFDPGVVRRTLNVNFYGAVRVTEAFLPRLAPRANIVMVSSGMGELSRFSPELRRRFLEPGLDRAGLGGILREFEERVERRELGGFPRNAYSVSKAALNAYTRILSRELELQRERRVNAVCPGWVRTRLGGSGAARSVEVGAKGIVWAATLATGGPNGGFFRDQRPIDW